MALDIFVGALTRYYLSDWETPGARIARELGADYQIVRPESENADESVTDPAVVKDAVLSWRTALETSLRQQLPSGLSWNEEPDTPYFTDRPAWDGYACLLLLAARTERPEFSLPKRATNEWANDAAYQAVTSPDWKSRFSQLYEVESWLPCRFQFKFKAPDVAGTEVWSGSSLELLDQLRRLDQETIRVSSDDVPEEDLLESDEADSCDRFARFGLEMFLRLVAKSVEHRLPMKLDY
jgi:hypothetical protein